jgi:hypothetical protein
MEVSENGQMCFALGLSTQPVNSEHTLLVLMEYRHSRGRCFSFRESTLPIEVSIRYPSPSLRKEPRDSSRLFGLQESG